MKGGRTQIKVDYSMAPRIKYAVFGAGMLALAVGVYFSVLLLLATRTPGPVSEAPSLRLRSGQTLAQTLEQTLGLSAEQAASLAARLQAAAAAAPAGDRGAALVATLQSALGLTEERAAALAAQLQAADGVGAALGLPPATQLSGGTPKGTLDSGLRRNDGGKGTNEDAHIGDQLDFVVRDAQGNVKQTGSSK
jgi:hypothetical protein